MLWALHELAVAVAAAGLASGGSGAATVAAIIGGVVILAWVQQGLRQAVLAGAMSPTSTVGSAGGRGDHSTLPSAHPGVYTLSVIRR